MEERYFREPNLSPSDTIRQHYVPRMLLSQFAAGRRIQAYDLINEQEFQSSVANVGLEAHFYDIEIDGQVVSTENWLSDIEGQAAASIRSLADEPGNVTSLSELDELVLARFLAAQYFRVPSFRASEQNLQSDMVNQLKGFAKSYYQRTLMKEEFEELWRVWGSQPDDWWLGSETPSQQGEVATFMLGEIQGIANFIRAMAWRAGRVPRDTQVYTSDNPMSACLPPVRPWWSGGAFIEHEYHVPLSPTVIFRISPEVDYDSAVGKRECLDFSEWETCFTRYVVTNAATRFLFGPGPYQSKQSALSNLRRINAAKMEDAVRLQGYDPRPPPLELSDDTKNSLGLES
jgi:hypothetical protein